MSSFQGIGTANENAFKGDGKSLVGKVHTTDELKTDILRAVDLIGGFAKVIEKGDDILLKPNYNSSDPPPATSDPEFLAALIELIFENGAKKITVGESSMQTLSTRRVMTRTGTLDRLKNSGAEFAFFDELEWRKVDVNGKYLKAVSLAERALEAKKVIYACCMKTHFRADFSLSLKLAFGFTKGSERLAFHLSHLKEKLVDLNLVVHPSLILMDARKCFITGGPFSGDIAEPNIILVSGDRIAIDVEAITTIRSFKDTNLKEDPWTYPQIRRATELGLGAKSDREYAVKHDSSSARTT